MYHNAGPAPLYLKDCVDVKRREMFVHWDSISLLLTSKTNAFRNAPAGCPAFMIPTPRTHLIPLQKKSSPRRGCLFRVLHAAGEHLDAMPEIRFPFRLRKNKFPDCFEVERSGSCVMICSPGTDLILKPSGERFTA